MTNTESQMLDISGLSESELNTFKIGLDRTINDVVKIDDKEFMVA